VIGRFTLQELAAISGGELIGDPAQVVTGAASLAEATAGEVSFFAMPKYMPLLRKTRASAVFVPVDFSEQTEPAQIRVSNPAKAFEQVVLRLAPEPIRFAPGIHPSAVIAANTKLGANVSIQPHAVIEAGAIIGDDTVIGANSYIGHETKIGANCLIYPHVTIRERCALGARVTIHSGAVIGADGFGFEIVEERHEKIPQIGIVQIDDDVEIGANTTIDRARFGRTWIQAGVKIDNLVQIGHNVVIGKHSIIAAQTGIAGSSRVGDYVMIGGQVGVTGHVEIGDRNIIAAKTGVSKNLPANGGTWWSTPATPLRQAKEQLAWIHRLGQLFARVKAIEKKLEM
jgi:UDP-3-O-[3-hydroxymyristoyl] glucosamine N-acyltransferase